MRYFELKKQEKALLKDFEKGRLASAKNLVKQKGLYQKFARSTLNKNKNINIRVSEKDLIKLKAQAAQMGIPYQTLAASILHRSSNREF